MRASWNLVKFMGLVWDEVFLVIGLTADYTLALSVMPMLCFCCAILVCCEELMGCKFYC